MNHFSWNSDLDEDVVFVGDFQKRLFCFRSRGLGRIGALHLYAQGFRGFVQLRLGFEESCDGLVRRDLPRQHELPHRLPFPVENKREGLFEALGFVDGGDQSVVVVGRAKGFTHSPPDDPGGADAEKPEERPGERHHLG